MTDRILFVDDEPNILQGFQRSLRNRFDVSVAESGADALQLVENSEKFAVIVADMQMPGMNGAMFLGAVRKLSPDSTRLMLTGNADQQTAIDAINQGDIFRFINKPCHIEELIQLLESGVNQFRLKQNEDEILNNTLKGSINALSEVLALTRPDIFGRTARLQKLFALTLTRLGIQADWELESLPLLCHVGYIVLPDTIIEKIVAGKELSEMEHKTFSTHPDAASDLLKKIPRLEGLADCLKYQSKGFDGSGEPAGGDIGDAIPFGARLLKAITDFTETELTSSTELAMVRLKQQSQLYDPEILSALFESVNTQDLRQVREVEIKQLRAGMTVACDIMTKQGTLLLSKGQDITDPVVNRLLNFDANGVIGQSIIVLI